MEIVSLHVLPLYLEIVLSKSVYLDVVLHFLLITLFECALILVQLLFLAKAHQEVVLHFAQQGLRICVADCSNGYFGDRINLKCVTACNSPLFGDLISKSCVNMCPTGTYGESNTRTCVASCPSGTF